MKPYKVIRETFLFTDYQHHNVWAAMARAGEIAATKTKMPPGALLDMVATDFLATNVFGMRGDPRIQKRWFAKVERVMKKRLIVVDPETQTVDYGIATLKELAGE